jgi:Protein of unknown function (DUF3016)
MSMQKLSCSLLLSVLCLGLATGHSREPANVRISFVQLEKFSDFRIQGRQENVSAGIFRDEVSAYLSPYVAKRFPGATLTLTFTDVDLAGRIDPSKTRKLSDARIERNVASPLRLYFNYTLTDSHKRMLASGSKSLVDSDYLYRYTYYANQARSDTLFYEKVTLSRWLSTISPSGSRGTGGGSY